MPVVCLKQSFGLKQTKFCNFSRPFLNIASSIPILNRPRQNTASQVYEEKMQEHIDDSIG